MYIVFDSTNNSITLNGTSVTVDSPEDLPPISSDVKQIYWYDTYGEITNNDGSMEMIEELEIYDDLVSLYLKQKERLVERERLEQLERDREFELLLEEEQKKIEEQQKKVEEEYNKYQEELRLKREEKERNRDYWQEFRMIRNYKLLSSDWTQIPDAPITEDQKLAWKNYRQQLRDLPENISDPKRLVLDENHPDWIVPPS